MIDWKKKLTSRKFWAASAGFASGLIIAMGGTKDTATQVTALILSAARSWQKISRMYVWSRATPLTIRF